MDKDYFQKENLMSERNRRERPRIGDLERAVDRVTGEKRMTQSRITDTDAEDFTEQKYDDMKPKKYGIANTQVQTPGLVTAPASCRCVEFATDYRFAGMLIGFTCPTHGKVDLDRRYAPINLTTQPYTPPPVTVPPNQPWNPNYPNVPYFPTYPTYPTYMNGTNAAETHKGPQGCL